jgi:hypothetical protein
MAIALLALGLWVETSPQNASRGVVRDSANSSVSGPAYLSEFDGTYESDEPLALPRSETRLLDMYGNPIETANGDYRVDHDGEIYERHSPDTAILRLGVPST